MSIDGIFEKDIKVVTTDIRTCRAANVQWCIVFALHESSLLVSFLGHDKSVAHSRILLHGRFLRSSSQHELWLGGSGYGMLAWSGGGL